MFQRLVIPALMALLALPCVLNAQVVFNDTFDIGAGAINDMIATRQAAGTVTSTYSTTGITDIIEDQLRSRGTPATTDTNFASNLGANDFTLTIVGRVATGGTDWTAFSMLGDGDNRGSSPISFLMRGNDRIVVTGGSGTLTPTIIQALGPETASWDAQTFATYAFVVTATDANSGTFDFTINGLVAESDIAYDFGAGDTERKLNWTNLGGLAVGRWDSVTLDLGGATVLGDFNGDGFVTLIDLDRYIGNLNKPATGALEPLDLDNNGTVEAADFMQHYTTLVETSNGKKGTFAGDLNLDGTVDVLNDAAGLINSLGTSVSSWAQGDVNGDGTVDVLGDAAALVQNLGNTNE